MSCAALRLIQVALVATLALGPAARAAAATQVLTGAGVVGLGAEGDGRTVTLQGEAIGDILRGGRDHVWVNLLSGGTAVGVWMPREMASGVDTLGDFHSRGTTMQATGVFNFACDTHGGELDIHATAVTAVSQGAPINRPVSPYKLVAAAVLAAAAALQAALLVRSRRRER